MSKRKSDGSPNGVDKDGPSRPFDSFDVQTMGLLVQNNGMPPVSNYMQGQMTMPATTNAQGGGGDNSYQYPRYQRGGMPGEPSFTTEEDLLSSFDQQAGNVYTDFLTTGSGGANSFQSHPGLFQGGDHGAKEMSEQSLGRGAPLPSAAPLMMPGMDPQQGMLPFFDPENKELIRMQLQSQGLLHGSEGMSEQLYNMLERQALMPHKQSLHRPVPSSSTITRQLNMSAEQDQLGSSETDTPSTTTSYPSTSTGKNRKRPRPEEDSSDSDCSSPSSSRDAAGVSSTNGSSASGQGKIVPDEEKDETYWEKRRKNNESAKRSREARRHKEAQISMQVLMLEQENLRLRTELEMVTKDCEVMEQQLRQRQLKYGNQQRHHPTPRQVYDYSHGPPPPPPPSTGSNMAHM